HTRSTRDWSSDVCSSDLDPTMERISGTDLNGYYAFDDDGVAAQRVTVVDKGVLKNFLMSRSPVAGFENSNGHGRKAPGFRTVGRSEERRVGEEARWGWGG